MDIGALMVRMGFWGVILVLLQRGHKGLLRVLFRPLYYRASGLGSESFRVLGFRVLGF